MQLKIGFVNSTESAQPMDYQTAYQELLVHTRLAGLSLDTAPPVSAHITHVIWPRHNSPLIAYRRAGSVL
jgi:hypothetical protein